MAASTRSTPGAVAASSTPPAAGSEGAAGGEGYQNTPAAAGEPDVATAESEARIKLEAKRLSDASFDEATRKANAKGNGTAAQSRDALDKGGADE